MFPEVIALSVLIALIRRGKLSRLADLFDGVNYYWMLLVPLISMLIGWAGKDSVSTDVWSPLTGWLHVATSIVFVVFFACNARVSGMLLMAVGQGINCLPIIANAGKMPVDASASNLVNAGHVHGVYLRHVEMSSATHLNFISDIIPVPSVIKFMPAAVVSPGDVVIAIGLFVLIQAAMVPKKKPSVGVANG